LCSGHIAAVADELDSTIFLSKRGGILIHEMSAASKETSFWRKMRIFLATRNIKEGKTGK